jgi:hypothetical protein
MSSGVGTACADFILPSTKPSQTAPQGSGAPQTHIRAFLDATTLHQLSRNIRT